MPTVLVVDDSPIDRKLIGQAISSDSLWVATFAESAQQALDEIDAQEPDVVVTDLVMPEMTGLELIERVRAEYPYIPVILLTGQGSDALAEEALRQGAASYVSKADFNDELLPTIDEVHSLVRDRPQRDTLSRGMTEVRFKFDLESDLDAIPRLIDIVLPTMHVMRIFDRTDRRNVAGALTEAVFNAMLHGNLGLASDEALQARQAHRDLEPCTLLEERRADNAAKSRRVHINLLLSQNEVRFVVRDQGNGFDPGSEQKTGRGLLLMRTHMDEVTFNDQGNEVTMVKRVVQ